MGAGIVILGLSWIAPPFGLFVGGLGLFASLIVLIPRTRAALPVRLGGGTMPIPLGSLARRIGLGLYAALCLALAAASLAGSHRRAVAAAADRRAAEIVASEKAVHLQGLLAAAEAASSRGDLDHARTQLAAIREQEPATAEATRLTAMEVALERAELERLPARLGALGALIERGDWKDANSECERLRSLAPASAEVDSACDRVDDALAEIAAARARAAREAAIPGLLADAEALVAAPERCGSADELAALWRKISTITAEDAGYAAAKTITPKLDRCRRRIEADLERAMITDREGWARVYERDRLDKGIDMRVSVRGKGKNHLVLRYVLLGRALAHQFMQDADNVNTLEALGFSKITFSDGFYESYIYDLDPTPGTGRAKLAAMGLPAKLALE